MKWLPATTSNQTLSWKKKNRINPLILLSLRIQVTMRDSWRLMRYLFKTSKRFLSRFITEAK